MTSVGEGYAPLSAAGDAGLWPVRLNQSCLPSNWEYARFLIFNQWDGSVCRYGASASLATMLSRSSAHTWSNKRLGQHNVMWAS